jgi:hypothetical protein
MKIACMAALVAVTGASANARQSEQNARPKVRVYVDNNAVPPSVLHLAEAMADVMFASAGVRIEWRGHSPEGGPVRGGALAIGLASNTPDHLLPGALAFARVYEGVHIDVFCDRLSRLAPGSKLAVPLLAHVLVHEITHILQGIDRHSDTGVMKACWTASDYADMVSAPLPFTPQDIQLILLGLAARVRGETLVGADSGASEQGAQSNSGSNGLSELRTLIGPQMNTD